MRPSTASLALPPPLPPWSGDPVGKTAGMCSVDPKKRLKKILSLEKNLEKIGDTAVLWLFYDCFIYGGFYAIWFSESHEGVYGLGGTGTGEFIRGWALILTRGCVLTLEYPTNWSHKSGEVNQYYTGSNDRTWKTAWFIKNGEHPPQDSLYQEYDMIYIIIYIYTSMYIYIYVFSHVSQSKLLYSLPLTLIITNMTRPRMNR